MAKTSVRRRTPSLCGLFLDARHVFSPDVDGFVENCDGFQFGHGFERCAQIGFVTFGIRRRHGHINVQPGLLGGAQRGQPLRRRGGFWLIHLGQIVAQRWQAHAEHETFAETAEQIEIGPRQRTAREDADVERGFVADEFQRTAHEKPRMLGQFPLSRRVGMADDLIRVGRAAINHRAIAVGLELFARRVLGGAQRGEKLLFVPRAEQEVIAPLGIRVLDAVFRELRSLFNGRRTGHITKPARVRTADRDVERPIRQAFVNEIVLRNDRRRVPEVHRGPYSFAADAQAP